MGQQFVCRPQQRSLIVFITECTFRVRVLCDLAVIPLFYQALFDFLLV